MPGVSLVRLLEVEEQSDFVVAVVDIVRTMAEQWKS